MNLAERLRLDTRELHTQAERSGVMRPLLRGELDRTTYCRLLRDLHAIYAELESALATHAQHPVLGAIHDPCLARADALALDLETLYRADWVLQLAPTPEAMEYVRHLATLEATEPVLLLAHAYVRYLGDLSGGQILRDIVRRSMRLSGEDGTRFYAFAPKDAQTLATRFRAAIQSMELDPAMTERLVAEAQDSFRRHVRMFEGLEAAPFANTRAAP